MISERNIKNSPLDYFRIRPLENTTAPHRRRYILPDMMAMMFMLKDSMVIFTAKMTKHTHFWILCVNLSGKMILVFGIWRFTNIHKIKLPLSDAAIDSCKKLVANVVLEFLPSMQWDNNQLAMSPFHCQLPMYWAIIASCQCRWAIVWIPCE